MKKFLTLKHWQLFLLMIGVPMIFQFIFIGSMIATHNSRIMAAFVPVIMLFLIGMFFGWFYALGTNLHKLLPPKVPMNLTRFHVFLINTCNLYVVNNCFYNKYVFQPFQWLGNKWHHFRNYLRDASVLYVLYFLLLIFQCKSIESGRAAKAGDLQ